MNATQVAAFIECACHGKGMWSPDEGHVIWEGFISGVGGAENSWNNHKISTKTSSQRKGIDISGGTPEAGLYCNSVSCRLNIYAGWHALRAHILSTCQLDCLN